MTIVDRAGTHSPAGARLLDDNGDVFPSLFRADTVLADVEGLLHGHRPIPGQSWPLVAALRQAWSQSEPLVWLAEVPLTETQTMEKARLAGTTVRVDVSHGSPRTLAAWTDVSRQAAAHTPALSAITELLAHAVAGDTDRMVARTLASLATITSGGSNALASVATWPGPRLIVLAPNGLAELDAWAAYAAESAGALRVVCDPYITENLCIVTAGVALGILGPERLTADQPSHLGIDVANMVTFALEVAPGAVATWESTGGSGGTTPNPLPSPTLISITPNTIYAGAPDLPTILVGTNFAVSMSARVTRPPNPPLYVAATYNSDTGATMVMPESEMRAPGVLQVHVVVPAGTPSPESNTVSFTVVPPPTPTLTNITPDQAGMGAIDKLVWLEGTGFTPSMQALSKFATEAALAHSTVYISPTAALFTLPASQLDQAGTVQIAVRVAYAAADSNQLPFEIVPPLPQPTLTDITPDDTLAGTTGVVVTMTGTNFADPMSARLTSVASGQVRDAPATLVSATSATFTMPNDLDDAVGETTMVQAYVWDAVPALSANSLPFRATALTPILTALDPDMVNSNAADTTVIARGSNFESPMTAVLSGMTGSLPCFNVTPTEAKFTIPAAQLVNARIVDIFVRCTDSQPSDSNSLPFEVSGSPILTDITPDWMWHQDLAITMTLTGQNFTPDCVAYVANTPMDLSTVVSLTEMTGSVNMDVTTNQPGPTVYLITVRDLQGNISQALPFEARLMVPTLTNITPDQMYYEDAAARVTFDGTNFVAGMHFYDNGADKGVVTIVSATQCHANYDPTLGTHQLHVGFGTGGVNTNDLPLECINRPVSPKVTILNNDGIVLGEPLVVGNQVQFDILGSGFSGPGPFKGVHIWRATQGIWENVEANFISDTHMNAYWTPTAPGNASFYAFIEGNNPDISDWYEMHVVT